MVGARRIWIERNYESCSGCRRCEIACSLYHEGRVWPEASRVRVFMLIPGVEIPHLCFQCEDYPCVNACPSGALSVDAETGAVRVDASRCTSCGVCITACPGRVPHLHPRKDHIVICDLCDGDPRCVEACRMGRWNALRAVPRVEGVSYRLYAKTPEILTSAVARRLFGEEIAREVEG
ncbi:MAG: 4Fe-4S dicluster domain-containing protein [Candidatus Bathyarchaeia archaeon]